MKMILASDADGVIGVNGELPWYLPSDLKLFKKKTEGAIVVMGSKTFDSMGALPNRANIVLTNTPTKYTHITNEHVSVFDSMLYVVSLAKMVEREIWIIGGSRLFRDFLPYCTEIHHSVVGADYSNYPPCAYSSIRQNGLPRVTYHGFTGKFDGFELILSRLHEHYQDEFSWREMIWKRKEK